MTDVQIKLQPKRPSVVICVANATLFIAVIVIFFAARVGWTADIQSRLVGDINSLQHWVSVPISLPAVRAGISPVVELSYNDQVGHGPLGVGWTLSAGGSLSRCPVQMDRFPDLTEREQLASDLDGGELFCFDGRRVRPTSHATFDDFSGYQQHIIDGVIFRKLGNSSGLFFQANTPNGLNYLYGEHVTSKVKRGVHEKSVLAWQLNKITDLHGQTISYDYYTEGGIQRLKKITYGDYRVLFYYDHMPSRTLSQKRSNAHLSMISRIEVFSRSGSLYAYHFSYQLFGQANAALKGIKRCDDSDCLTVNRFRWKFSEIDDARYSVNMEQLETLEGDITHRYLFAAHDRGSVSHNNASDHGRQLANLDYFSQSW